MLKHSDIIGKLDALQKIAIISSALDPAPFEQAGVTPAKRVFLDELAKSEGIPYADALRSWDRAAVGAMTGELVSKSGRDGGRLFVTPDLKTAVNPYAEGLSEDPYLNGAMGAEIVGAIHAAGGAAGLYTPSLGEDQTEFLDKSADGGAVHELMVKPFLQAAEGEPCEAVFADPSREGTGYYGVNRAIFNETQNGLFGDVFVVGDGSVSYDDAALLLKGKISLGGAKIPLERASRRYAQLKGYEAEGSVPRRETEDSLRDGSAIDDAKLDEILDGIIDFAITTGALKTGSGESPEGGLRAAVEGSFTLLKNEGVLPLKEGAEIAVLGEAYGDLSLLGEKFRITGSAVGYDRLKPRSDDSIPTALRAAREAGTAVVFLYPDYTGRELALPPNRLVLLDALKRAGKRIIAVVCGSVPVDMGFDRYADAVLVAPCDCTYAGDALARVLGGDINPSGRLTRTCYDDADKYFSDLRADRDSGRMRIGGFVGYRRYASGGKKVRYPFGFGLGYTEFKYSSLSVKKDEISFDLTNCGKCDGAEVAQVYVGVPASAGIAPKKQLRAFKKVFLKAGETVRVTVPAGRAFFETFDSRVYSDAVAAGNYAVYVGSSVLDIKLTGSIAVEGDDRSPAAERVADYFTDGEYDDVSEVSGENRIGKSRDNVPRGLKNVRRAALYCLPLVALVIFLLVSVLILSYALDYILLSVADEVMIEWILYIIAVGVLAMWPVLGSLNRKRLVRLRTVAMAIAPLLIAVCFVLGGIFLSESGGVAEKVALRMVTCFAVGTPILAIVSTVIERQLWRNKMGKNRWDKYYFSVGGDEKATPDGEFETAFAFAEAARAEREAAVREAAIAPLPEVVRFYDKELTFAQLSADCSKFLAERGLSVEDGDLRNYIAAVFSTQFIIVPEGSGAALCAAVAEYFGKKPYIDNAEKYARYDDLFTQWRKSANAGVPTNLGVAVAMAGRESAYLHTALIRHVKKSALEALFMPIADLMSHRITALPAVGGKRMALPQNILIVAEVEGDTAGIPAAIAEACAVLDPSAQACEPAAVKTVLQTVGYERLSAMRRTVRDFSPVDEELWKKVDALDARSKNAHIGNYQWVRLETHSSVALACGEGEAEALDGALAAEIMPWLSSVWHESGGALADVLPEIFGAENVGRCLRYAGKEEQK